MGQGFPEPNITEAAAKPNRAAAVEQVVGVFPLSHMQESLWWVNQLHPDSTAYNLAEARRLEGQIDRARLAESLDALIRRQESLRTVFRIQEGQPVQVILGPDKFPLRFINLSSNPPTHAQLQAVLNAEAALPFHLSKGPLARGTLFQLSPEEHLLLINLHHIICDQWSLNVFFSELARTYSARIAGNPPSQEPPALQYADFAVWQRESLTAEARRQQAEYWRAHLRGPWPSLDLAADRPRPPVRTTAGRAEFMTLSADLAAELKRLSRSENATLFMTLLAGLKLFLHRYCRQTDILVGSPLMCRDHADLEQVIGFFVNAHALRTDLSGDPTFTQLLQRVRETVLGAEAHRTLSFDQVLSELPRERNPRAHPLFQVICAVQPAVRLESWPSHLRAERVEVDNGGAKFDWSLLFTETRAGLELRCEYSTDLFESAGVIRRMGHLETLWKGIVAHPGLRLSQFKLLTETERTLLLSQPGYRVAPSSSHCLHDRFAAQAERTPNGVAITMGQQPVSYSDLNRQANRLAHYLRRHQVGPETPVGLYLDRSAEQVIAILAVLKAGGAYLPIDPAHPAERLRFMLDDSQAPIILTDSRLAHKLPNGAARIICLDSESPEISSEPAENPKPSARPGNIAYIIYTSGSTGKPKGVLVTHHNVARLFQQTEPWFGFNSNDVWCLFHSYTFDFSVWELWGALLYGGRLVVVPHWVSRSPVEFYSLLAEEGVTVLNQTPSAFRQLMWAEAETKARRPLKLRYVIFGGEALDVQSLRPWFEIHGDDHPRLVNMYGITETTVHVTHREVRQADLNHDGPSLIGVPIPDLKLYLLDQTLEPVPVGVAGEICVGGAGVARGYLNRPELTSQRFIADPFSGEPEARLYRSGDLARYNRRGELEYLGRSDHQVKIRGFRVELGEIETALNRQPGVRQSLVITQEDPQTGPRLVAYIVPQEIAHPPTDLPRSLEPLLPEYMIPGAFVFLEKFPLTINGKVDCGALPAPGATPADSRRAIAPRNPAEKQVAAVFCELLQQPSVGVDDNFFALGGHSLLATQAMFRLGAVLNRELSVRLLFESPTVAGLAEAIARAEPQPAAAAAGIPRRRDGKAAAEQLLARLDTLSPAEIDQLLNRAEGEPLSA